MMNIIYEFLNIMYYIHLAILEGHAGLFTNFLCYPFVTCDISLSVQNGDMSAYKSKGHIQPFLCDNLAST